MAKRYDEPIEVVGDPIEPGAPIAFSWRGRRYDVDERLTAWREGGEWWDPKRARERDYFRVLARPAGALSTGDLDPDGFLVGPPTAVYDLYFDRLRSAWHIERLWD